jgi:hypothetical protein
LPHFFAPATLGNTEASAISMARETFAFVCNAFTRSSRADHVQKTGGGHPALRSTVKGLLPHSFSGGVDAV